MPGRPSEATVTGAAELRARICEAAASIAELEARRAALDEIRDGLTITANELVARLAQVQRDQTELSARIGERQRRIDTIRAEVQSAETEVEALERRCSAAARAMERMTQEAEALARAARAQRGDEWAAEDTLRTVQDSVDRIRRKLEAVAGPAAVSPARGP